MPFRRGDRDNPSKLKKADNEAAREWAVEQSALMNAAKAQRAADQAAAPPAPPRARSATYEAERILREVKKKKGELSRNRDEPDRYTPAVMHSDRSKRVVNFRPGVKRAVGYRLIDLTLLQKELLPKQQCSVCKRHGTLMIDAQLEAQTRRGLASELPLYCSKCCEVTAVLHTSDRLPAAKGPGLMDVNMRAVVAATQIGTGEAGLGRIAAGFNMYKMSHDTFCRVERVHREAAITVRSAQSRRDDSETVSCTINATWPRVGIGWRVHLRGCLVLGVRVYA